MKLRVLVTGAAGFIGSSLVRRLRSEGHSVAVILRDGTSAWRIRDIIDDLVIFRADLSNLSPVREQLAGFSPECAVHLAWQGVGNQHRNDVTQLANLRWSFEFLRMVHALGCRHYVALGSQAEYGPYSQAISEDLDPHPTTVYGMAKLCHCLQAQEFCRASDMRFAWLRLFSAYGPGDDPGWMIPYMILKLLRGERPSLTAGDQRWDYIYADDAAEALSRVICSSGAEGIFNLGSGEAHLLRDIIKQVRDLVAPSAPLGFGEIPYRADQVMHLQADIRKLTQVTGWHPRTDLRTGLQATAAWYLNRRGGDAGADSALSSGAALR